MRFDYIDKDLASISADLVLVFVCQEKNKKESKLKTLNSFHEVNKILNDSLKNALNTAEFKGKKGETFNFYPENTKSIKWVVTLGLGDIEQIDPAVLRNAAGSLVKNINGKVQSVAVQLPAKEIGIEEEVVAKAFAEGILLGKYRFNKYKKEDKEKKELKNITIQAKNIEKVQKGVELGQIFSEATNITRDLVNEQSAIATPAYLADFAKEISKKDTQIKCKIIDEKEAQKLGMNAFLGIARASSGVIPPKFIHLEYEPKNKSSKEKLALVGKGITFDSGGMNVKPGDHMMDMKIDMSGAAMVLGIFSVISRIKPDYPVLGLIAATPNLISGTSIVPGDIVKAMNGKTIEILNTDAEGRVTMADTLSYAGEQKATKIIDFATLTGAAMVALGTDISALFSNDKKLKNEILESAKDSGEKIWELPLEQSYKKLNKSDVADIANVGSSRYGGTITAALFLEEFVKDGTTWAHLDIAGPAYSTKPSEIAPKGATGHGVRTILKYLSK